MILDSKTDDKTYGTLRNAVESQYGKAMSEADLLSCGCGGKAYMHIEFVKHYQGEEFRNGDALLGIVAECKICGTKTRVASNPTEAQMLWNNAFRNNADVLAEIRDLRERVDRIEGKG